MEQSYLLKLFFHENLRAFYFDKWTNLQDFIWMVLLSLIHNYDFEIFEVYNHSVFIKPIEATSHSDFKDTVSSWIVVPRQAKMLSSGKLFLFSIFLFFS